MLVSAVAVVSVMYFCRHNRYNKDLESGAPDCYEADFIDDSPTLTTSRNADSRHSSCSSGPVSTNSARKRLVVVSIAACICICRTDSATVCTFTHVNSVHLHTMDAGS